MKQPQTVRGDDQYLTAFALLSTTRQFPGNGIGPIPWDKAWDYASKHGFRRRMCNYFAQVILMLDGHYREHLREEQDKEAKRDARRARRDAKRNETGASGLQKRRDHRARAGG